MAKLPTYLEWHGRQLRVRVKVPLKVRDILGKTKLVHPLHTDSVGEANRLKLPYVYQFKATIEEARRRLKAGPKGKLEVEALRWREVVSQERKARQTNDAP